MDNAFFSVLDESISTGRYLGNSATGGPWSPDLQHGGPPNALAVYCAERLARTESDRADLIALRVATDFIGPVPVGELRTTARLLRAARSAALVEVTVRAGERECLLSRVWLVRDADTSAIAAPLQAPAPPNRTMPEMSDANFPYGRAIEWRVLRGGISERGPGTVWARPRIPLFEQHEYSGLQLAAMIADSASGISAELDWSEWSFLNIDLNIHLARPVVGEWVHMDAVTQLGARGSATASSVLSDVEGELGRTLQTLILAPQRR